MVLSKKDALQYIAQINGKSHIDKAGILKAIEVLKNISSNNGLSESEIDFLIEFLTSKQLASPVYLQLFDCLIPKTIISKESLEVILLWFFTGIGNEKITSTVEKKFIKWITGLTYYELVDSTVMDSYFHSFLFLLSRPYLESLICRLLSLLCKPEDANRWVVQQVLHVQTVSGPKAHTNSLLSLLKSYRSDVVPETVPVTNFYYKDSTFDEALQKAHARKLESGVQNKTLNESDELQWNSWKMYDEKSKKYSRLIPSPESLYLETREKEKKKLISIMDFKTMASLGLKLLQIECPAQTLSLLANLAGNHILAFSSAVTKTRFSHKLYHTLFRVFPLELEPYSDKEKIYFLNSIKGLEEYTQQGIPVVTTFLFNYLSVWDGESYLEQILGLLEWLEVVDERDLEKHIFPQLRQVFISSGTHCRCLIIKTMGKLMRNLLVMDKREKNCFTNDFQDCNVVNCIEALGAFVKSLITIGLLWNNEQNTRDILMTALDFYETSQAVEEAGDLPIIMVMPPALVYSCLFSGSRLCIARICSLLVLLQVNSIERLNLLGVYEDFAIQVQQLNIYMLDIYRCLWANINFRKENESFIFNQKSFCEVFWKYKDLYGEQMQQIFGVEFNLSFCNPQSKGIPEILLSRMAEDFPSIFHLKQVAEERSLQVFSNLYLIGAEMVWESGEEKTKIYNFKTT